MKKTLLLVSQVYVPDPAAVGQHMADAAVAMAAQGWRVLVFTANRGYDDPKERFPGRELLHGVEVCRLPFSSIGKQTIAHRLVGQLSFCIQAFLRGLFVRGLDTVLVTTSPPMGSAVGWALSLFRRVKIRFWVMDINPDQTVILGHAKPGAFTVKLFNWFNRRILRSASSIIVLDRFMARTIESKAPEAAANIVTLPPWPLEDYLERVEHEDNPFRREHGLAGKFVVMYSGNHSLAHPLDTLLEAALRVQDDERLVFLFVGGGRGKEAIEKVIAERSPRNIRSLPYQPLNQIKFSLSAADLHLVAMGPEMVGIVHPCKFYGAMSLAKPILLLGPRQCHIGEVLDRFDCGWVIEHGDVDGAEKLLRSLPDLPDAALAAKGAAGRAAIASGLSKEALCRQLGEALVR